MRFYAGIERRCTQVAAGARWHVGTDALLKQGECGGSRGSVFQTGLRWGARTVRICNDFSIESQY